MKFLIFISILTISFPSWSYIPKFWMILSRTAENHGRGFYKIEQDVVFSHGNLPQVVREVWIIGKGQNMYLEVTGRKNLADKLHLYFVYRDNKKYQVNTSGDVSSTSLSLDWLESYFHFRYSKTIRPRLLAQNIIPPEAIKIPKRPVDIKDIEREPESFIRLSRVDGRVAYGIHHASPHSPPGIWIQQDQFHVQRLRLLSQVQVSAREYKKFARRFWFPSRRIISWDNHNVEIRLVKVTSLSPNQKVRHQLNPDKINPKKKTQTWGEDEFIKDFYNRFR